MGCTPTAHRLSTIPSNNVVASSKSTKSTIKNSQYMLSPQKMNMRKEAFPEDKKVNRYYSPEYRSNRPQKGEEKMGKNVENIFKDVKKIKTGDKYSRQTQEMKSVTHLDSVSQLSLNSHLPVSTNLSNYEAKTIQEPSESGRKYLQETPQFLMAYSHSKTPHPASKQKRSRRQELLENELRHVNNERFERISVQKMNF